MGYKRMSVTRLVLSRLSTPRLTAVPPLRTICLAQTRLADTDAVIHTGQQWSKEDLRSVRFSVTGIEKEVNNQWAIDLIAAVPVTKVKTRVVSCDGGGGALGHPKIFINLDHEKPESCNYCGLRFQLEHH